MRPSDKSIHNLLLNLKRTTRPELDAKIIDDCFLDLDSRKTPAPSVRPNWSMIMHSRLTKQLAAAVILIAALLSLTLLDNTVLPAYAIEQTLEAIQKIQTLHMQCRDWDNNGFEMWVQLNPDTGIPDYCRAYWPTLGVLDISRPDKSYQYSERSNYVQINSGKLYNLDDCAPARIFEQLVQLANMKDSPVKITFNYETDPGSGKTLIAVLIENPHNTLRLYIDERTKLPVRVVGLKNEQLGNFIKDIDSIEYDIELPEDIFDFQIPKGARVFDHDEFGKFLNSRDYGIATDSMTEEAAATEILTLYWNALKADDHDAMFKVFPSPQPRMVDSSAVSELVSVGKPYIQNGCGIGKVVPCRVRLTDGRLMQFMPIVRFRSIDGQPSCIIAGQWGGGAVLIEE